MQKLPIGIQSFTVLREENYVYVDKTEQIYALLNTGNLSLRNFSWQQDTLLRALDRRQARLATAPVILINFNDLNYLEKSLAVVLDEYMDRLSAHHGLLLSAPDYKSKFQELIERLGQQGKVALLIDEYDKAIIDLLENEQKTQENIATLKNFYSVLKSTAAEHLHFVFLTGVSKYGKISIFSDLNNLLDITLDPRFATLLGYTQTELEHYFSDRLDQLAQRYNMERPAMLAMIARWYNGFSWDGVNTVYVPFSTLVFLEQQTFANHWFSTATPSFLIKLLRKKQIPAYELEKIGGGAALVESADVNDINVHALLFHTGYLTVKQVRTAMNGQAQYILGYPNFEVSQAFQQYLLADYLSKSVDRLASTILFQLEETLHNQNVEGFINITDWTKERLEN